MSVVYSGLAVDMGAKHTGIVSYTTTASPQKKDIRGAVFELADNALIITTKTRTAVRHRLRSGKRFDLVRRLLEAAIPSIIGREMGAREKEAIFGLMKRRGYSRLETEIDMEALNEVFAEPFAEALPDVFNAESSLADQWAEFLQDIASLPKVLAKLKAWDEKKLLADFTELNTKENKAAYKAALKCLKESADAAVMSQSMGHKHRTAYLAEIRRDIARDSRLSQIVKDFGTADHFWRFIGNLSNLQLRALRWYFNDREMYRPKWDAERFQKVWLRAHQFFHYEPEDRAKAQQVQTAIRDAADVVELLKTLDPELTIPPYEDQNNRRPPIDMTLLLSPKALDIRYGDKWQIWTRALLGAEPWMGDRLDEILVQNDRKSRLKARTGKGGEEHYSTLKVHDSYVLQRFLDRSKDNDRYAIRRLVRSPSKNIESCKALLSQTIGSQHLKEFLSMADAYYKEVDAAKKGLWVIVENPLMERSDIHPKMKGKVLNLLVGNMLGVEIESMDDFIRNVWNAKVSGRSTVRSVCSSVEAMRKEYGNSFEYERQKLAQKLRSDPKAKLTPEEKRLNNLVNLARKAAREIADRLSIAFEETERFPEIYALSQLYSLIETERNGFTKTTLAAHEENRWRMTGRDGQAACTRLPADSTRPFDGALRKLIDRLGYELARYKADELIASGIKDSVVQIGMAIEENKFTFSADLASIKNSPTKKKMQDWAVRGLESQKKRWLGKEDRIRSASRNICPYTGGSLGDNAEIDHIIPRSATTSELGTIFNSEANLICCSQKGNQKKSDSRYRLQDLNDNYLSRVFGTNDRASIERRIESEVERLCMSNPNLLFDLMSDSERDCVRHALFMPGSDAYKTVTRVLAQSFRTRVNGTQAWLARSVCTKLRELLKDWCAQNGNRIAFDAWQIDNQNVSSIRSLVGERKPEIGKPDDAAQPIISHSVDALCVLSAASADERIRGFLGTDGAISDGENIDVLMNIIPEEFDIRNIQPKSPLEKQDAASLPLFKETIYAEHFLPIMIFGERIRIGFDWGKADKPTNSVQVKKGEAELLAVLKPFFEEEIEYPSKSLRTYHISANKAFELLHTVYVRQGTREELIAADALESLIYTTVKTPVASVLYDAQKKTYRSRKDILESKSLEVAFKPKFPRGIAFEGNESHLVLPAAKQWQRMADLFAAELGQKADFDDVRLRNAFVPNRKVKVRHPVRRVFSLPLAGNVSGPVRIRRKDRRGNDVYQLYAKEGFKAKGFAVDDAGMIQWDVPVIQDSLVTDNQTVVGERFSSAKGFVGMNEAVKVFDDGRTAVIMSIGTADRRYVVIQQPFEDFKSFLGEKAAPATYYGLPALIKATSDVVKAFKAASAELLHDCQIGYPRPDKNSIVMLRIGRRVAYRCVAECPKGAKDTFQKAWTEKHK